MFRSSFEKTVEKAQKHFKKGELIKSKDMYLKCLAHSPDNIGILNNLAQIYRLLGEEQKAMGYNEILLKKCDSMLKHEKDEYTLMLKTIALVCLKMDDKAFESAEEILKINPNNLMALQLKSQYLEKNNQNAEAIQCLKKILMEEPSDLSIFLSLGRNYVEIGEFNQAEALYNLVLEIEPKNKAAIRLKSKLLKKKNNVTITSHDMMLKAVESFEMENFDASDDYFKKALEMDSNFDEIWFAQGELYVRTGRIGEAIDSFKKAFEINPTSGGINEHEKFFKMLNVMKKINTLLGLEK